MSLIFNIPYVRAVTVNSDNGLYRVEYYSRIGDGFILDENKLQIIGVSQSLNNDQLQKIKDDGWELIEQSEMPVHEEAKNLLVERKFMSYKFQRPE